MIHWPKRAAAGLVCLWLASLPLLASDQMTVLQSGSQAGHYLVWKGKPRLLIGDSVTQGWMESGANFDQRGYVDALAARGINLLMLWAYKGTNAQLQRRDARIGYDAPELWPWAGISRPAQLRLAAAQSGFLQAAPRIGVVRGVKGDRGVDHRPRRLAQNMF